IGMTRGSEFAALAANRRLRGVTHDEGRAIFGRLMAGQPSAAINVLLAAGERAFYQPAIAADVRPPVRRAPAIEPVAAASPLAAAPASAPGRVAVTTANGAMPTSLVKPLTIDLESAPYLRDHLVHGVPTLPGAFLIGIAADAARELRPRLAIVDFENTSFRHFVRVYPGKPTELRLDARVVETSGDETHPETLVRVQVLSDFVHKSGAVLQKDVVQTEIFVRMATEPRSRDERPNAPSGAVYGGAATDVRGGLELPDPYLLAGSPVLLNGRFKSLGNLRVAGGRRLAHYRLDEST
ncbi:MAG TPA: hypothetical protein VN923_17320, partial [Thermoanaerobaculia bacterium]|nr:hypothetical protein [Thermoanaerobaculia bacterium]